MNPHEVIKYPLMGEKATLMREETNTLTFIVSDKAKKPDVKQAVETLFKVKVTKVNTLRTMDGKKKAHVMLDKSESAEDVASQLGVI